MTVDKGDVAVLVHVTKRIRPIGSRKWDDAGIAKFIYQLVDRGFGFDEILDRVVAHGRDRAANTPAVLLHHATGRPAEPTARRNPTKTQQCPDCGLRRTACVCDPRVPRKPVVDSQEPDVKAALDKARDAMAAARGGEPR